MFYYNNQPIGLVKTKSDVIVRSVQKGLGIWMLVQAVISVNVYPFLAFSNLSCHFEGTGIGVALRHVIVRRLNLEVTIKRLLN